MAFGELSPSTAALLASLPDTPNSMELKVQYLAKANELRRGDLGIVFKRIDYRHLQCYTRYMHYLHRGTLYDL